MRRALLLFGLVLLLCSPVQAWLSYGNQRLDRVFYPGHDEKTVLFVEIVKVDYRENEADGVWRGPPDIHVEFLVLTVLRGEPKLAGQTLRRDVGSFNWPEPLVPRKTGARAILIARSEREQISCLLPAHRDTFEPVESREAVLPLLARDLLDGVLACGEADRERKRQLLLTVGPILTAGEAEPLERMLGQEDPWLRRAMLAAWLHATKDPDAMELAAKDLADFLSTHSPDKTIKHPDGTPGYNPYPLFFDHYFFLDVGWSSEEDRAAVAFRQLFRLVEKHARHVPGERWQHAIRPLCRVGGTKDLPLLHEEYRSRLEQVGRPVHERQEILLGMGRILGLELSAWVSVQFPAHESEQYAKVLAALK